MSSSCTPAAGVLARRPRGRTVRVCEWLACAWLGLASFFHPLAHAAPWGGSPAAPTLRDEAVGRADLALAEARRAHRAQGGGLPTLGAGRPARLAVAAYEAALALAPAPGDDLDDVDLHHRLFVATVYLPDAEARWRLALTHFDAMRAGDPRDPRETDLLPDVCTALSKLAAHGGPGTDEVLERAVREYATWRARTDETDPQLADNIAMNASNTAELLMALGPERLPEALALYAESVALYPGEPLGWYGLAVAADRDGQVERGESAMRRALELDPRMRRLTAAGVYFVPHGDLRYYEGLAHQVAGRNAAARDAYRAFLAEGKTTRYGARARAHLTELRARP
ncbi:MAG: hypothetical protein EXR73_09140 [Myxococcales bacterium]|nr:hypothetical protein [Myxococcales bacterium]